MTRATTPDRPASGAARTDAEGELYAVPRWLSFAWAGMFVLIVLEAVEENVGILGPSAVYELWLRDVVLGASALLVLGRAFYEAKGRAAWVAFGVAMAVWTAGTIAWDVAYGGQANPPFPTFADPLWLAWYPCMAVGIFFLIRVRIPQFELHRWMDGIAAMLVVLVAGFALVVQPEVDHTHHRLLVTVVDFAYPVLDVLLIGCILGVYGLLGWRPDRMWVLIGLGTLLSAIADAAFAVQEEQGVASDTRYSFVWTLSALVLAYAAWAPVSGPAAQGRAAQVTGLRAVALPLVAQALAGGIQLYALFEPLGPSERIITLAVVVVTMVQIVLTRPRRTAAEERSAAPPPVPALRPLDAGGTGSPMGRLEVAEED